MVLFELPEIIRRVYLQDSMNRILSTIFLVMIFQVQANGMFMAPSPIPLERIVKNTEAYLKKNPKDAAAYYTIARAYYLSFYNQSLTVPGFDSNRPGSRPSVAPSWMSSNFKYIQLRNEAEQRVLKEFGLKTLSDLNSDNRNDYYKRMREVSDELQKAKWKPKKIEARIVLDFAEKSKVNFLKATQLSKDEGLYYLGLASLYLQVNDFLNSNKLKSEAFKNVDEKLIKSLFWKSFLISKSKDQKRQFRPPAGLPSLVSYEAGKMLLTFDSLDESRRTTISKHLKNIEQLKVGPITPLVITRHDRTDPGQFTQANQIVDFDLNGDGISEKCPWVTPETGILVWDPMNEKHVHSGRQLFGNYTFQLIWKDGFAAISSLDNNADKSLSEEELNGISIWYDRNSNGKSEPGEVSPISNHGIKSLDFKNTINKLGMKVEINGVNFKDGSRGNLWDWVTYPE